MPTQQELKQPHFENTKREKDTCSTLPRSPDNGADQWLTSAHCDFQRGQKQKEREETERNSALFVFS